METEVGEGDVPHEYMTAAEVREACTRSIWMGEVEGANDTRRKESGLEQQGRTGKGGK